MIADSLRMWVREYHVDGFRFDLAITLARDPVVGYDKGASFLDIVYQDPVLSQVKLIAEHWDVGEYGYQVGNFPPNWSEWNGKYRDTVRKFWKGDKGQLSDFAQRLSGSGDPYRPSGRGPRASVNFVTAHDGFTLRDLVSYNDKHNEANGEDNQDGASDTECWNCRSRRRQIGSAVSICTRSISLRRPRLRTTSSSAAPTFRFELSARFGS